MPFTIRAGSAWPDHPALHAAYAARLPGWLVGMMWGPGHDAVNDPRTREVYRPGPAVRYRRTPLSGQSSSSSGCFCGNRRTFPASQ
jgi:hypothetical protein